MSGIRNRSISYYELSYRCREIESLITNVLRCYLIGYLSLGKVRSGVFLVMSKLGKGKCRCGRVSLCGFCPALLDRAYGAVFM